MWNSFRTDARSAITAEVITYPGGNGDEIQAYIGNDDSYPSPAQVDVHEAELKRYGKAYEFHRYDGTSHGFFYYQAPAYRPEAAMDGWAKIFSFFSRQLSS
jgi:carboxymethylenebutenolidase